MTTHVGTFAYLAPEVMTKIHLGTGAWNNNKNNNKIVNNNNINLYDDRASLPNENDDNDSDNNNSNNSNKKQFLKIEAHIVTDDKNNDNDKDKEKGKENNKDREEEQEQEVDDEMDAGGHSLRLPNTPFIDQNDEESPIAAAGSPKEKHFKKSLDSVFTDRTNDFSPNIGSVDGKMFVVSFLCILYFIFFFLYVFDLS